MNGGLAAVGHDGGGLMENLIGGDSPAHQRMRAMMDAASDQSRPPLPSGALENPDVYRATEQRALAGDAAARAAILNGTVRPKEIK